MFQFTSLNAQKKIDGWLPVVGVHGDTVQLNGIGYSFLNDSKGRFLIAGNFTNSLGYRYVASWNDTALTEVDSAINTLQANSIIYGLCEDNKGNYYAGTAYDKAGKWYVSRWDGNSWKSLGGTDTNMIPAWYIIYSMCTDKRDNVYAATINKAGPVYYIVMWDGSSWKRIDTIGNVVNHSCQVLLQGDDDSTIYAAGGFINKSGKRTVAKWNGHTWTELGYPGNELNADDEIYCLVKDKLGNLYAAGSFGDLSGNTCVAKWNGSKWSYLGPGTLDPFPGSRTVRALYCDADNNVYAGGDFMNKSSKVFVAKWDGVSWNELGAEPATLGGSAAAQITSISKSQEGTLYVSGRFINTITKVNSFAKYSTEISLSAQELTIGTTEIKLYPNPAASQVQLIVNTRDDKYMQLQLRSVSGVLLEQKTLATQGGTGTTFFNADNRASGVYFIVISDGNSSTYTKLEVQH